MDRDATYKEFLIAMHDALGGATRIVLDDFSQAFGMEFSPRDVTWHESHDQNVTTAQMTWRNETMLEMIVDHTNLRIRCVLNHQLRRH